MQSHARGFWRSPGGNRGITPKPMQRLAIRVSARSHSPLTWQVLESPRWKPGDRAQTHATLRDARVRSLPLAAYLAGSGKPPEETGGSYPNTCDASRCTCPLASARGLPGLATRPRNRLRSELATTSGLQLPCRPDHRLAEAAPALPCLQNGVPSG